MSKREGFKKRNLLDTSETRVKTVRDVDADIYQTIRHASAGYDSVEPVNIFSIIPDWTQPRRAIPSPVRALWNGDSHQLAEVFQQWVVMVQQEHSDGDFELGALLEATDDSRSDDYDAGPLEAALLHLAELAASIKRDGLTNPITVVPHEKVYLLETGERRWLAYHLLYAWYGEERWLNIPVREMRERSVWRQASENMMRRDLNAIGVARQFATLLMDLLNYEIESPFLAFEEVLAAGHSEQAFYAQVADGESFRIPKGKGPLLLGALGLKNAVQLRQHRALLRLPEYLWVTADDLNWSETYIRELMDSSGGNEDVLGKLVQEVATKSGYTVNKFTESGAENQTVNKFTESKAKSAQAPLRWRTFLDIERLATKMERISEGDVQRLADEQRDMLLEKIATLKKHLRQVEKWLEKE